MLRFTKVLVVFLSLSLCLFLGKAVAADEITEGMGQGDFAMALVKSLGAEGMMSTAATNKDAFVLLEKLGCVPPGGWDEEGIVDAKFLASLLGISEEESAQYTFEDLLAKLQTKLSNILWGMGIKQTSPQTITGNDIEMSPSQP